MLDEISVHEIALSLSNNIVRGILETDKIYVLRLLNDANRHLYITEQNLGRHYDPLVRYHRREIVQFIREQIPPKTTQVAQMTAEEVRTILYSGRITLDRIGNINGVVFFEGYIPIANPFEYPFVSSREDYFKFSP